jgi:type 1 fimbriae regulatory protein FimB/type 1 fimbriae regulatory protein FimE
LVPQEVELLITAARDNRWGHRDATMILVAYRHGLRASEACDLQWTQISLGSALLHVRRRKNGSPSSHPLGGRELRALRRLRREQQPPSPFVFVSERGAPFSTDGFAKMLARAAQAAGLETLRVRLQARQPGPRHPSAAGLSRPQEHPAHGPLHGAGTEPVQALLG